MKRLKQNLASLQNFSFFGFLNKLDKSDSNVLAWIEIGKVYTSRSQEGSTYLIVR
jgi:hypothetical protein